MIRVLLVDDQPLVRAGLRVVFQGEPDMTVCGEAADGIEAVHQAERLQPDLVVMDIRMPRMDGIEATRQIVRQGGTAAPRVLVLTTYDLDENVYDALAAGAQGFLLKDAPPEDLAAAVRVIVAGDAMLAPSVTRRLVADVARRRRRRPPPELSELTDREAEVLRLIVQGRSNAEIGSDLRIAASTVKTHVGRVLSKLGLRDRVHAVMAAYEWGLLPSGEQGL